VPAATAGATVATTATPAVAVPTPSAGIDAVSARVQAAADALVGTRTGISVYLRVGTDVRTIVAGLASRNPRLEMRPEVRLEVASVTKAMTATIVMSLVEQGALALDDSVDKWLPGLLADGREITVEQLLTHSSGLFNFVQLDAWDWLVQDYSAEEIVALAEHHGPAFRPGERAEYSNTGYVVLGLIVEAITGDSLRKAMQSLVFEPAGMTGADLGTRPMDGRVQARGYDTAGLDVTTEHLDGAAAAGGVVATARDVGAFLDALFDGKLVRAETVADMAAVHSLLRGTDPYGYGLSRGNLACVPTVGHAGELTGFSTNAWRTEDGSRTVVVVVNDEPTFEEVLPTLTAALCP
jgi:D-alanyl-D-alanine carboxypeptidase